MTDKDIFDNRLIFGDNLLALKALEQEFAGKVKCVFIDPPYNTGCIYPLRRWGGAFDMAFADARPVGVASPLVLEGWFTLDHDR